MSTSDDTAARRPRELALVWAGGRREVKLDSRGRATFPAIRASQLRIQVRTASFVTDLGFDSQSRQVGVGIQELRLTGLPFVPMTLSTRPVNAGCGSGPDVHVNGAGYRTSVTATPAQLSSGRSLPASICVPGADAKTNPSLNLHAGTNDVAVSGSDAFDFESLVLRDANAVADVGETRVAWTASDGPVRTVLRPGSGDTVVDLGQNENPGWEARQDGQSLRPVVLNGWQQGWLLRGTGPVVATYAPDLPYRIGLGVGLGCLLLLAGSVLVLTRRRSRRPEPSALSGGSLSVVACQFVAGVTALLVAGWPGLVVAGGVAVAVAALGRWLPDATPWVLAVGCLAAAAGYFLHPWTDPTGWAGEDAWPHYVALVPVLAAVVLAGRRRRPTFLRRRLGASTSR